jgi:hypothetical protein
MFNLDSGSTGGTLTGGAFTIGFGSLLVCVCCSLSSSNKFIPFGCSLGDCSFLAGCFGAFLTAGFGCSIASSPPSKSTGFSGALVGACLGGVGFALGLGFFGEAARGIGLNGDVNLLGGMCFFKSSKR